MNDLSPADIGREAFALLFERNPQPMCIYGLGNLKVLAVNDAALALYGYRREEFLGLTVNDILAPELSSSQVTAAAKQAPESLVANQLHRHRCRDGRVLTVRVSAHGVPFRGQSARLVLVHDISDLVDAKAALRERERMLTTLTANLPGMAYRCLNTPDWPMQFVSEGCLALTGYRAEEWCDGSALSYSELIHPDDRDRVWQEVQAALAERQPFQLVYRLRRRHGEEKWVWEQGCGVWSDDGGLLYLEGFIADITTQRQTEQALRESEQRFRALFEQALEGVFQTSLDGRFLIANPACARILGYDTPEQLLAPDGPSVETLYLDAGDRFALLADLRANGAVSSKRLRLRRRDGGIIWVDEKVRALFDQHGELSGMEGMIEDVSARVRTDQALRASEERFSRAARGANDGLWDWNLATGEMYYSPRWKAQLGYGEDQLRPDIDEWLNRIHPEDRPAFENAVSAHLADNAPDFEAEYRIRHADGQYRWMLARGVKSHGQVDTAGHLAGSQTDITLRKQAELRARHDAMHDSLTGLPNRALLLDRLQQTLRQQRRSPERKFAVLYLDLDRFKQVNDSLGHAAGDALLREVTRRWRLEVRDYDTLARLGGDEFVLLLDNLDQVASAMAKAQALLAALTEPVAIAGVEMVVGCSIGVVFVDGDAGEAEGLLRDADCAMYRAKAAGRNRAVLFEPEMRETVLRSFELEKDLRTALDTGQLGLHYQPINRLVDRSICGYEALLRWQHPRLGAITPKEFLPLAEEAGLSLELDMEVTRRACRQLAAWRRDGQVASDVTMAVNLSASLLGQADLPERIGKILAETGLPGSNLKLEITEHAIIGNLDSADAIIDGLRRLEVGVVLDDFGTGYSSLSHLYRFHFDGIKVDQSFVQQISHAHHAGYIMEMLRLLGEKLCINVVPEGIEEESQLEQLRQLGFLQAQGHVFARPQSAEDVMASTPVIPGNGGDAAS